MFNVGLVSVSFRKNTPEDIVNASAAAGLSCIEWGGDVHAVPGNIDRAREICAMTEAAGMSVAAYGSYYRLGEENRTDFNNILETAKALNAPIIRVWAYNKGSSEISKEEYIKAADDAERICGMAGEMNIKIALECHANTLTDDYKSSLRLLKDVSSSNLYMYWQPNQFRDEEYNLKALSNLSQYITNVHVFQWDKFNKYPLEAGKEIWGKYLELLSKSGRDQNLLLEFMPDDRIETLKKEAGTLMSFINNDIG